MNPFRMAWLQETKSSFQKTMLLQYVSIVCLRRKALVKRVAWLPFYPPSWQLANNRRQHGGRDVIFNIYHITIGKVVSHFFKEKVEINYFKESYPPSPLKITNNRRKAKQTNQTKWHFFGYHWWGRRLVFKCCLTKMSEKRRWYLIKG